MGPNHLRRQPDRKKYPPHDTDETQSEDMETQQQEQPITNLESPTIIQEILLSQIPDPPAATDSTTNNQPQRPKSPTVI